MATRDIDGSSSAKTGADRRIVAPIAAQLRLAGWLSVLASALWPVQAAAIAWAVAGWVDGDPGARRALLAACVFVLCALIRAGLEHRSGAILFEAADQTIARERAALIGREARAPTSVGSAGVAALIVQKLPVLQPWITRYHVAMMRARVLPLFLLLLAFSQSWLVGLTLFIAGPLIPVFMTLVGMAAEVASKRQMQEIGTMNEMVMDRLSAMLDIRLLGATERTAADFADRTDRLRRQTLAVLRIAFLSSTVLELFSALGVAMVAVFVGFTLLGEIGFGAWGGGLSLGQGIFLLLIAPEFFQPLRDLAAAWHDRAAGFAVVADLDAIDAMDRTPIVGKGAPSDRLPGDLSLSVSGAAVELSGQTIAMPDMDLTAGGSLALTGPSGSGKSTMLSAMAGLMPIANGEIRVNGTLLDETTADAWRARVALIPQRPHFPDERLGEWLKSGTAGCDPWPALELAGVAHVVRRLPDGLQTRLGESGGGVSGGEARRLLLARAIHSGADLILADEPTADLDAETAGQIIRSLQQLQLSGCAVIVATHDPDLAAAMDAQVAVRT